MALLKLAASSTSLWLDLVQEAEQRSQHQLQPEVEHYVVQMLNDRMTDTKIAKRLLAIDYLQAFSSDGQGQIHRLRDVGDACVLYAGLFPARAKRKGVDVNYFLQLGRSAYGHLAKRVERARPTLFKRMAKHLEHVIGVLQSIPGHQSIQQLDPLSLCEWYASGGHQVCSVRAEREFPNRSISSQRSIYRH